MTRRHPKPLSKKLRSLYRWHRWLGIISALFVIWLAGTGILLEHADDLQLDRRHITQPWALKHYGIQPQRPAEGLLLDGEWLAHVDGRLFFNERPVTQSPPPIGFTRLGLLWAVACRETLWLLNEDAEVLDHIEGLDLPGRIHAIGSDNGKLLLATGRGVYQGDPLAADWPHWRPVENAFEPAYLTAALPTELAQTVTEEARNNALDWERLLLDAHSGRLFGPYGVWLMDAMAVIFIVLGITGLWLWLRFQRASRARKRRLNI